MAQRDIEYDGRRPKRGRYSTGALFRPREKRVHRQLGGDLASEARREWTWPGDEEQKPNEQAPSERGEAHSDPGRPNGADTGEDRE